MTSFRFLQFLLFLLFHQVYSEAPEPVFRPEGSSIEMGYCFGVDYIVVYRASAKGDQLLGNSSADNTLITPPADLQGRITMNKHHQLLGLQIKNLTHLDSGIYRRECWQDQALGNYHTQQLTVCNEEIESKEIIVRQEDGGAEILCNSTSIGGEGTSVHWYYETHPHYRPTLFLDSSVSLKPLVKDMQGAVEVRDSGALLLLSHSMLNNNQQFHCLVIKGGKCLSFQNMYTPSISESRDIFASHGDRVVLPCTYSSNDQLWETPMGMINDSSVKSNHMFISSDHKTLDYSLVISAVDDEYEGEYSCISPSHEIYYSLIICPKKELKQKSGSEGGKVSLECDVGPEELVQWYRQKTLDTYELFYDSNDETIAIPEDFRGRLTLSHDGSILTLSDLVRKDEGLYYCVVLRETVVSEGDDTYDYDYNEEETEDDDDESSDGAYLDDDHRCVFKQETVLSLMKDRGRGLGDVGPEPETSPTAGPEGESNATGYALGIGLALLLVVVIAAVIVIIKKRGKTPPQQSEADAQSGLNTSNDVKMNVEPSCTDSLAQNDEFNA